MSQKLAGKVAIITGGSDGIGEATALRFAEEGAKVVIMARGETKGLNVQENIRSKGGDATFISCDVSNSESVRNAVASAVSHYNGVNILVNNEMRFSRLLKRWGL